MRTVWNIVSFMAIVNMLALIVFGSWLWRSDRLSRDRLQSARAIFAPTFDEAEAAEGVAESGRQQDALAAKLRREQDEPPLPSAAQIDAIGVVQARQVQAERRLEDQADQLLSELNDRARALQLREEAQDAREAAWKAQLSASIDEYREGQFAKTVRLYEALPGKQGKQMLVELVAVGAIEQAVRYIDAMQPRAASKIIRELKTDEENALATELLERLRALEPIGTPAETTSHDDAADTANTLASGNAPRTAP